MKTTHRFLASSPSLLTASLVLALVHSAFSQAEKKREAAASKPTPDVANFKYGPHQRNVFDLWRAKSDQPTPLVVFIHGGGFRGGDKGQVSAQMLKLCLDSGISVAAVNYRLSPEVHFPAHYLDCARAIQTMRSKAKEWNLDPKRVAATGGSAGAGTSLWLGFHDDLADPKSNDPVARQSTRLTCMAVNGAQSSYDPRVIKEWIGGRAHEHPALEGFFGITSENKGSPEILRRFEDASAINHLTKDDAPVWMLYNEGPTAMKPDAPPGAGIHHINFGFRLKVRMDKLGIECAVKHRDDYRDQRTDSTVEMVDFFKRHFGMTRGGTR
jgi:acetyl esterase